MSILTIVLYGILACFCIGQTPLVEEEGSWADNDNVTVELYDFNQRGRE